MARKKIIAGNWKMNKTPSEAVALVAELKDLVKNDNVDVVYCVPAIDIVPVVEATKGTNVSVGAENMYFEESGAYTGEISAAMLVDAGVKYVIIGHSERRDYFKEDDVLLNKKVKKAFEAGITPILCCGESLEQRELGVTMDWIRLQIKSDLAGITADQVKTMVIAYEPIWAIGTGKTATSDQAQEVCKGIRDLIAEIYDEATAEAVRIQYGGSMNAGNAAELLAIYAPYVEKTAITFEYTVPSVAEFAERMQQVQQRYPYLVAEQDGKIVGYAYVSPFKERAAYDWSVETSIYVDMIQKRKGIGRLLYDRLEEILKKQGILNVNACIGYPQIDDEYLTKDSVYFHEKLGYHMVGTFHQCGYKFGRWYDMVWMEKFIGEHTKNQAPVILYKDI
mgnify:CR=1 FL=1